MSNYTLHQGDCLEILPTLAAGSVDAVICDPPYGGFNRYKSFYTECLFPLSNSGVDKLPTPVL